MAAILEARKVTKRYQGLVAINDVSFALERGEILGLIGPNGAGKTTLINLISGTQPPTAGSIVFEGNSIDGVPAYRRSHLGIGRTFQIMRPFPGLTVLDNVAVGALFGSAGGARELANAQEQARRWLAFVGLEKRANQRADALGGPDRKRLELAKALAQRPKLLLLDEVMAGLNPAEIDQAVGLIGKLSQRGLTIVIVEHVMRAIMAVARHIVVLDHGQKIAEGTPKEIVENPEVVRAYLGSYVHPPAAGEA